MSTCIAGKRRIIANWERSSIFSACRRAGPGLIFWHPKGGLVRNIVERLAAQGVDGARYDLVYTPHIMRRDCGTRAGTPAIQRNMSARLKWKRPTIIEAMNARAHFDFQIEATELSRIAGAACGAWNCVSYERSGVLHGLLRVRDLRRTMRHFLHAVADEGSGSVIEFAYA